MSDNEQHKRLFELPKFSDLTQEQEDVLFLEDEDFHLVIGGPGTGKSVVAMMRAKSLIEKGKKVRILMYNHMLRKANNDYLTGYLAQHKSIETWMKWFSDIMRHCYKQYLPSNGMMPVIPSTESKIDIYNWDWNRLLEIVQKHPVKAFKEYHYLIIDEGQDMPEPFYRILMWLGLENLFIVADQNQQLHPDKCSSRQAMEDTLNIETDEVHELRKNHRNTYPIARLADHFYPGNKASTRPTLPEEEPSAMTPILKTYAENAMDPIYNEIVNLSDMYPRDLIGILTPNNIVREQFHSGIKRAIDEREQAGLLQAGRPILSTYSSQGNGVETDFLYGGIVVINAQSCKGLEFETVYIVGLDDFTVQCSKEDTIFYLKSLFYVMASRARERIILLRSESRRNQDIDKILPNNEKILQIQKTDQLEPSPIDDLDDDILF